MNNLEYLTLSNSDEYLGVNKPINSIVPAVSVMVTTYQHEQYISQCLDSILSQIVDFDFEIVIGEDNSTDNTREICKSYAEKYPNIIRLHLRDRKHTSVYDENGNFYKSFNGVFTLKSCKGRYIAICEGDDYWLNTNKLQEQFNILETNTNINLCFHNYKEYIQNSNKFVEPHRLKKNHFSVKEVILGDGNMMATCSLFFRSKVIHNFPDWVFFAPVGDFFIQIFGSLNGGAIYKNDIYSVYRTNHNSSWSSAMQSPERILNWYSKMLIALNEFNIFTIHKFETEIEFILSKYSKLIVSNIGIDYSYRAKQYRLNSKLYDKSFKLKWIFLYRFKYLHLIYLKLRG